MPSPLQGLGRGAKASAEALAILDDQAHLFAAWPTWRDDVKKGKNLGESPCAVLLAQLAALDEKRSLAEYRKTSIELLRSAAAGENPMAGLTPTVPAGATLTARTPEYREAEARGVKAAGACAFVLVAGGLGERLGFSGIKVALPTESTTGTCYLELYVKTILAFQEKSGAGRTLPLCIMLSGDTAAPTRRLLKEHGDFGAAPGQIVTVVQDKVPALADASGRFVLNDAGDGVDTKPHGHGDVHALLCAAGLPETWLAQGFEHVFFFQDTNAFALRSFAANLGVAVASNADAHSGCVARKPGEAMGALCRLEKADGTAVVRNVEYNQLAPLLQETTGAGDVTDATGSSPYPGNTNQLLLKLGGPHGYVATLRRSNGAVPEFVNPKYADETRTTFKKPTRLECMMQDYPLLLTPGARVGFCVLKRDALREYSPVKNATADGAAKVRQGLAGACAATGESDVYALSCDLLKAAGVAVGAPERRTFADVPARLRAQTSPSRRARRCVVLRPRTISAAASPRPASAEPPRRSRGRDPPPQNEVDARRWAPAPWALRA